MSGWRRKALELLPSLRVAIERAETAHGVFFGALPALEEAYRADPPDQDFINRAHQFGTWCLGSKEEIIRGAALASFYEHLPDFGPAWRDLPRWVSEEHLATIREHLRGYLDSQRLERELDALDAAVRRLRQGAAG